MKLTGNKKYWVRLEPLRKRRSVRNHPHRYSIELPDYKPQTKIRIRRGLYRGEIFTVHESQEDWFTVKEVPGKEFKKSNGEKEKS